MCVTRRRTGAAIRSGFRLHSEAHAAWIRTARDLQPSTHRALSHYRKTPASKQAPNSSLTVRAWGQRGWGDLRPVHQDAILSSLVPRARRSATETGCAKRDRMRMRRERTILGSKATRAVSAPSCMAAHSSTELTDRTARSSIWKFTTLTSRVVTPPRTPRTSAMRSAITTRQTSLHASTHCLWRLALG